MQTAVRLSDDYTDPLYTAQNEGLDLDYDAMPWTVGSDQLQMPNNPGQFGLGNTGINWLSPQFDDGIDLDALFAGMANGINCQDFPNEVTYSPNILETQTSSGPLLQDPTSTEKEIGRSEYYVSGDGARVPFKGKSHRRGSVLSSVPSHETGSDGSVPSPLLHHDFDSLICPLETYDTFSRELMAEMSVQGTDSTDIRIPTHQQVQICIERYFQLFHPVFPFLRRASFMEDASQEWLLLLAVSVVGARLTGRAHEDEEEVSFMTRLLSQTLQRREYMSFDDFNSEDGPTLFIPGQSTRSSTFRSTWVLQACVLCVICMLHSGEKNLIGQALNHRHRLVEACDALGMLKDVDETVTLATGMHHLEESITEWVLRETKTRTGMMIWLLDCIFVYTLDERPLMRLDDIKTFLPSCEELFENPEASWLRKRRDRTLTMPEALELLCKIFPSIRLPCPKHRQIHKP